MDRQKRPMTRVQIQSTRPPSDTAIDLLDNGVKMTVEYLGLPRDDEPVGRAMGILAASPVHYWAVIDCAGAVGDRAVRDAGLSFGDANLFVHFAANSSSNPPDHISNFIASIEQKMSEEKKLGAIMLYEPRYIFGRDWMALLRADAPSRVNLIYAYEIDGP